MAGSANSIQTHNVLRGRLSESNVIEGTIGTGYNPTYALVGEAAAQIVLYINSSDYKMYAELKDKNGNHIMNSNIIDLPLETMVVNGSYDSDTREVVLILDNGNEIRFSVADLVRGLVSEEGLATILGDYVKFTDYATDSASGVLKTNFSNSFSVNPSNGVPYCDGKTYEQYGSAGNGMFIGKQTLENVITGKQLVNKTYVDEADDVFEEDLFGNTLINDSGENITLENTIEEGLLKINLKGNTSQEVVSGETGDEVNDTSIYVNDVDISKENYIMLKGNISQGLPSEYQAVEYIESNGTQYIDTGFIPNQNTLVELEYSFSGGSTGFIYGARESATHKAFDYIQDSVGNIYFDYGDVRTGYSGYTEGVIHRIKQVKNEFYIDDIKKGQSSAQTFTSPGNMYLFGCNDNGAAKISQSKIYYMKLYDNETLIREYIPCYRISDNVIGLYDMVNGIFCTNSGTGLFTKGDNISLPNPDYPQEIGVVTGNNIIKVEGKNLLNYDNNTNVEHRYIDSSGNYVEEPSIYYINEKINVSSNTSYIFSFSERIGGSAYIRIAQYKKDGTFISRDITQNNNYTITMNANCSYVIISVDKLDYQKFTNLQLEVGSTATTYEQYVGNTYEINLGKNLFDKDNANYVNLTINTADMRYYNASDNRAKLYYIKCKPNTTYTYSKSLGSFLRICSSPNIPAHNGVVSVVNSDTTGTSTTITTGANDNYISIYPLLTTEIDTVGYDNVLSTIQIEKGSSATSYAPYFTPIELCKIGTNQDRIYKSLVDGNWYLHKEIGKYVFNSTRTNAVNDYMSGTNEVSKNGTYSLFLNDTSSDISNNTMYFSVAKYEYNSIITGNIDAQNNLSDNSFCMRQGTNDRIYFKNSAFTGKTGEEISPLLNGKTLFYVLITPTDTQITDTTLVSQLEALYTANIHAITHINTETSNLLPYIDLKYNVVTSAPSPDRASEVKVVTGNNAIKIQSKNLFDKDNANILHIHADNSTQSIQRQNNFVTTYLPAKEGETYTISSTSSLFDTYASIFFTDESPSTATTFLSNTLKTSSSVNYVTATAPSGTKYVCFYMMFSTNQTSIASLFETIQIEQGSTATSYIPYQSQTFNVNLGSLEFCKIGDYQDYIYYDKSADKWYKYAMVGKFQMNNIASLFGNLTQWQSNFNATNGILGLRLSKVHFTNLNIEQINFGNCFCNRFTARNGGWNDVTSLHYFSYVDGLVIWITYDEIGLSQWTSEAINDLETRLTTYFGDTIFYLPLATPTTTEITNSTLIAQLNELKNAMSYYDKTLITQTNANKPFILDVTTFKNTTKGKIEVIEEKNQSFENKDNKVITINSSSTDTQYPSAKCVYDLVGDVESILETLDVGSGV